MKKIILMILLVLLTLSIAIPVGASAYTVDSKAIQKQVEDNNNVKSARCLVYGDNCVVAIQTLGIITKSSYDQLVTTLVEQIKDKYPTLNNCIITRSVRVYREIDRLSYLPQDKQNEAIEQILELISNTPRPMPYMIGDNNG